MGRHPDKGSLDSQLKQFLDASCQDIQAGNNANAEALFLERLDLLLTSEDSRIQRLALHWVIDDFVKHRKVPDTISQDVVQRIRPRKDAWLLYPLLEWIQTPDAPFRKQVVAWLAELDYTLATERLLVTRELLILYLQQKTSDLPLQQALIQLDAVAGEVVDLVLHSFPGKTADDNRRMIELLGLTGRYRVVKPLISFASEFPEYLRDVMRALRKLDFDDVDQFYLQCLDQRYRENAVVLIEAIKQVRRRRLKKAVPLLDALFPIEDSSVSLINRAVNAEIALTMASFGAYTWARDKLLPEMMLSGVNQKYLKAIEMLHLEEAVPLLKAIMLMPEAPEIKHLQDQAYRICERLLLEQKATSARGPHF